MKKILENEKQTIDYLLGDMAEADRDWFEERLFIDEDLSLALDAAENDLVDEYLRGELNAEQKQKFESNFLISERRREKLRAAEILRREIFSEKSVSAAAPQVSFREKIKAIFALPNLAWAGGLAAILLFFLVGGILFLQQDKNPQIAVANDNQNNLIEPVENKSEENLPNINVGISNSNINLNSASNAADNRQNPKISPLPDENRQKEIKPEKPQPTPQTPVQVPQQRRIFAFTLLPVTRSGRNPTLNIPQNTENVRLQVVHNGEEKFVKYRVELRNSDGDLIWNREIPVNQKARSKMLVMNIENKLLKTDSYELTLLGLTTEGQYEETNFYNFTVRKN